MPAMAGAIAGGAIHSEGHDDAVAITRHLFGAGDVWM